MFFYFFFFYGIGMWLCKNWDLIEMVVLGIMIFINSYCIFNFFMFFFLLYIICDLFYVLFFFFLFLLRNVLNFFLTLFFCRDREPAIYKLGIKVGIRVKDFFCYF